MTESPDFINNTFNYNSKDAISFGYYQNELLLGYNEELGKEIFNKTENVEKESFFKRFRVFGKNPNSVLLGGSITYHRGMGIFYELLRKLGIEKRKLSGLSDLMDRTDFKYAGRLWFKNKGISFWSFPRKKEVFQKLLDDIKIKMQKIYNFNIDYTDYEE